MSCSDKKNTPQNVNNQSMKLPLVVIKWLVLIKMWKYIVFSLAMEQIHLYWDRRSDTPKGSNIVNNFEISKQNNPTGLFTHWALYTLTYKIYKIMSSCPHKLFDGSFCSLGFCLPQNKQFEKKKISLNLSLIYYCFAHSLVLSQGMSFEVYLFS